MNLDLSEAIQPNNMNRYQSQKHIINGQFGPQTPYHEYHSLAEKLNDKHKCNNNEINVVSLSEGVVGVFFKNELIIRSEKVKLFDPIDKWYEEIMSDFSKALAVIKIEKILNE